MDGFAPLTLSEILEWSLRFLHVLFGIAWIGMLYFFNLVNVPVMAKLDGPTKGKLIPVLMPKALWVFRWAALGTWVIGFVYYAIRCIQFKMSHTYLLAWLVMTLVFYGVMFFMLSPKAKLQKDGRVIAALVTVLTIVYFVIVRWMNVSYMPEAGQLSSQVLYIGYGGGIGTWMFLNVWGIIWRNQKKIIAWTAANAESGTAMPAETPILARQAFLASRANAWLSIPMLLLMILAPHGKVLWP